MTLVLIPAKGNMADSLKLQTWRRARGWTQEDLAQRLGVAISTVSRWESETHHTSMARLRRLAQVFETSVSSLFADPPHAGPHAAARAAPANDAAPIAPPGMPALEDLPRDVPVYGAAGAALARPAGYNGALHLTADPVDKVRRPPALLDVPDAYAVFVDGDSMAPLFRSGDLVFLHPHQPPRAGDAVLIEMRHAPDDPPEFYIKELLTRTAETISTRQYNPAATIEFDRNHVIRVHKILTGNALIGL